MKKKIPRPPLQGEESARAHVLQGNHSELQRVKRAFQLCSLTPRLGPRTVPHLLPNHKICGQSGSLLPPFPLGHLEVSGPGFQRQELSLVPSSMAGIALSFWELFLRKGQI